MLIVIEGVDGSGKGTQTALLAQRLAKRGAVRHLEFPMYKSDTSALVRMYLSGAFGADPFAVNPYTAASFFAVDRMGSYLSDWKADYDAGTTILCDRYTTSNAVHQASKLEGAERDAFLDWLFHYEYTLMGLPTPDLVLFLDMPPEHRRHLIAHRSNKMTGEQKKDIHESDEQYLDHCYETALYAAERFGWTVVPCVKDGNILSLQQIGEQIDRLVMNYI